MRSASFRFYCSGSVYWLNTNNLAGFLFPDKRFSEGLWPSGEGKKKLVDSAIYERGLRKLAEKQKIDFIFMELFYAGNELNKTKSNRWI